MEATPNLEISSELEYELELELARLALFANPESDDGETIVRGDN